VNNILATLRQLGPTRLAILGAVAAGLVAFFGFFISRLNQPDMGLLFSELSTQDAAQIISKLEAQNIPYELRADGSQIYVPADRALRLRMSLAEQGLPKGGTVGYEIFDRTDAIGATSFIQNLNHLRALEGELARTIGSLGPVAGARVHLVVPRRDLFSRERQEPTASVVLRLRTAGTLTRPQVQAIQHLVASSVAGLKPNRVSVIDDQGNLLARGHEGEESTVIASNTVEMRRNYEQRLARAIEELLERSVGPGKVRAEVTAEMDFDRVVTNTESFDPDGQVVRSTQTATESSDAQESDGTPVSVAANLPDADVGSASGRNITRSTRSEETINYEISRTTRSHIREGGVVRRLSVAVLVDGTTEVRPDGTRVYTPRTPEEMERLTALAKSAIGFDEQRGDRIEIVNLPFTGVEAPPSDAEAGSLLDLSRQDYFRIAELLVLGIVGILVVLLVLRPLVSNMFVTTAATAAPNEGSTTTLLPGRTDGDPAALAPPPTADSPSNEEQSVERMIDLERVEGRVKASSIKKIGEIVEKHPEEAVAIIRNWMYQES